MKPILVTRPSPDGEVTCAVLHAHGVKAHHTPLMEIIPTRLTPPATGFTALAFTSANGVRAWAKAGGSATIPGYYVGPASAEAAKAAGLAVAGIAGGDVESLTQLLTATIPQGPVLHVRGRHAAGDLVGALGAAGLEAKAIELYEARAAAHLPPLAVRQIEHGPCAVALFSPRTARLFGQLVKEANLATYFPRMEAFCLSTAVADAAKAFPFQKVMTSAHPDHGAFVDMVLSART